MKKTITVRYGNKGFGISCLSREGDGPTVVFIHGLGCSKEVFHDVWEMPVFEPYKLVTFDLLGFGDSSKPSDFPYRLEDHAEICKLFIEELDLDRVHLVGHSMGGAIGLILIDEIPSRFSSFLNLEGNLIAEDCFFSREVRSQSLQEFERSGYEKLISAINAHLEHRLLREFLLKSDPRAFYKSSESLVSWSDSGELLEKFNDLSIRKAYVFGEANRGIPVIRLLKGVSAIEIPNSGHFMMLDNPTEFYQTLPPFFDQVRT